jgi:AcrR family transcriptional regulator
MSIVVEHEKRQREILEKALEIFVEEGFENTTIQKIADRCGITRTTLYIYFKNKKEIFNYSIKQLLGGMEDHIAHIQSDSSLNSVDKIGRVLSAILDQLVENRRLLKVILDYLLYVSKTGADPHERVRRRTLRLKHILASMVIEGVRGGEIIDTNIRAADDFLYNFLESAIFRLTVLDRDSAVEIHHSLELALNLLRTER